HDARVPSGQAAQGLRHHPGHRRDDRAGDRPDRQPLRNRHAADRQRGAGRRRALPAALRPARRDRGPAGGRGRAPAVARPCQRPGPGLGRVPVHRGLRNPGAAPAGLDRSARQPLRIAPGGPAARRALGQNADPAPPVVLTMSTASSLYADHLATLHERAATALERGGFDHLVVPSGTPHVQVFDDREYPYAANPQFKHWLTLTRHPGCWLVVTPGQRPRLVYLQPRDYWHVVPQAPEGEWVEHFDIVVIRRPDEALKRLPRHAGRRAILGEPQSPLGRYGALRPNNPGPALGSLDYHRAYKTPYEIEMLREATRRGVRAHRSAERAFRAGASEFGIHLAYCQAAGQDTDELPYANIVALNEHAAVLHYTEFDRLPPRPVRSFLLDAGASHAGYACDITRTHAQEPGEFQALIDAVDAAQQRMCDQVRAGTDYRQLHLDAHLALAGVLREAGLVKVSPEEAVATGVS